MLGFNVFAADTVDEAEYLATSMQQAFVNLRSGRATPLPPPVAGYADALPRPHRVMLDHVLSCSAIGGARKVAADIEAFIARTGADELMITSQIFDHRARLRSFEIAAQLMKKAA
jgi:alkanesulfonate monooxygenase SsuD/methylene tetrahydromethanopterin reductase-like flavin-dependent oxidoreductase (luciferase family)